MVHELYMNKTVIKNKTEGLLDFPLFILDWDGGIGTIDNNEPSWEAWQVTFRIKKPSKIFFFFF